MIKPTTGVRKALTLCALLALAGSLVAADFKFVVYSDIQGGGEWRHAKLPGIIERIPGKVVCAVSCGDMAGLSNSKLAEADTWERHLKTGLNLGVPLWPCRGNHDGKEDAEGVTLGHWREAMSFVRERKEFVSGGPSNDYYAFMYDRSLFVVLNNMNIANKLMHDWLRELVKTEELKNAEHIFVFQHYAMMIPNKPEGERVTRRWKKLIEPYFEGLPNLSGVFWGDRHWFWKGEYKGISGVLVPPGTTPRDEERRGEGEYSGLFSGYIVVHVKDEAVTAKAYTYDEEEQAAFDIKEPHRTARPDAVERAQPAL